MTALRLPGRVLGRGVSPLSLNVAAFGAATPTCAQSCARSRRPVAKAVSLGLVPGHVRCNSRAEAAVKARPLGTAVGANGGGC